MKHNTTSEIDDALTRERTTYSRIGLTNWKSHNITTIAIVIDHLQINSEHNEVYLCTSNLHSWSATLGFY
jgi:hypothetical protein